MFQLCFSEKTESPRKLFTYKGLSTLSSTPNRAVLEPILADLDRLWEMRHWIPEPGKPVNHSTIRMT